MDKHQKHPKLAKPNFQSFGRCEIGIVGAPCGVIESMCKDIARRIDGTYNTIYIDADHGSGEGESDMAVFMDMISHHKIAYSEKLNNWESKIALRNIDVALVNSNHFDAQHQVVIINPAKKESLHRKLNRLTNICAVVLDGDCTEPFDFIQELITASTPILNISDIGQLTEVIKDIAVQPVINGLVLAGGKSSRMGADKSQITYHGIPQEQYMYQQLAQCIEEVFISKRHDTTNEDMSVIADSFMNLGPFGAILSAFRQDPNAAWLVTACDQPLLRAQHIQQLIDQRDPSKVATCYYNPDTDFPEPLITLWEPKAYPVMLNYLALGNSCPRKVLINSDIKMIKVEDHTFMRNANNPTERESIMKIVSS